MPKVINKKIAVARIFNDLIKADRIVDTGEMDFWAKVCENYNIDRESRIKARDVSFAEALAFCAANRTGLREDLLGDCKAMTVSDGFCAHSEALLMIALITMLDPATPFKGEVFSIPRSSFDIDISTALYVEDKYDEGCNTEILAKYRSIFKEFQLAGFHFVYIPKIIDHYQSTDPALFKDILSFLAPSISESGLENIYASLMNMSTGTFCKDLLCNKCGITELRNTTPSLFIKIGNSYVGEDQYANYLKIDVEGDILLTVQTFLDLFTDMLSSDIYVVNTSEERDNQFHFHGFYKQLLDIFLIQKNIRSTVLLDPYKSKIIFPDADLNLGDVNRRERALYVLLLCYGEEGVNFNKPKSLKDMEEYDRRMQEIRCRYRDIYDMFGGDAEEAPDITVAETRRPIFSRLNKALSNQEFSRLYNQKDYNFIKSKNGTYSIHLDPDLIFVEGRDNKPKVPLKDSRLYAKWCEGKKK
ncbi:MAG: hypothetical protein HDS43_03530 [Bacteroides sp.]|nr:hypothetical protein [Bacteroides sp.]